jgi:hypothetical protein
MTVELLGVRLADPTADPMAGWLVCGSAGLTADRWAERMVAWKDSESVDS